MTFEFMLTLAVLITGLLTLIDIFYLTPHRKQIATNPSIQRRFFLATFTNARAFFPVLIIVLVIRSFIFEPFRIPSGSLEPSLLIGDFIIVNKYAYGVRLPVTYTKILKWSEPQRGDIAVFRYPVDPSVDFIKRIIGLPGDRIRYSNKVLYVNDQPASQQLVGYTNNQDAEGNSSPVVEKQENLTGVSHHIYQRADALPVDFEVTVPPNHYFAMGDNRDDSNDSRYWGFVPEANLAGKAKVIWFSWDADTDKIRWQRLGKPIH